MFEWLNANQGAIIGLANVALVLVTIAYAWLTWRAISSSRAAAVGALLVVGGLDDGGWHESEKGAPGRILNLRVVNVGNGPAAGIQAGVSVLKGPPLDLMAATASRVSGAVQAHEPPRETGGVQLPVRSRLFQAPSALEADFSYVGPPGWAGPSFEGTVECTVQVTWVDALGDHRVRRRLTVPIERRG